MVKLKAMKMMILTITIYDDNGNDDNHDNEDCKDGNKGDDYQKYERNCNGNGNDSYDDN